MNPYDKNIYFVLSLPNQALDAILVFCIQSTSTVRKNDNKNKAVVKLPIDDPIPAILQSKTPKTHPEMKIELANPEWN